MARPKAIKKKAYIHIYICMYESDFHIRQHISVVDIYTVTYSLRGLIIFFLFARSAVCYARFEYMSKSLEDESTYGIQSKNADLKLGLICARRECGTRKLE